MRTIAMLLILLLLSLNIAVGFKIVEFLKIQRYGEIVRIYNNSDKMIIPPLHYPNSDDYFISKGFTFTSGQGSGFAYPEFDKYKKEVRYKDNLVSIEVVVNYRFVYGSFYIGIDAEYEEKDENVKIVYHQTYNGSDHNKMQFHITEDGKNYEYENGRWAGTDITINYEKGEITSSSNDKLQEKYQNGDYDVYLDGFYNFVQENLE